MLVVEEGERVVQGQAMATAQVEMLMEAVEKLGLNSHSAAIKRMRKRRTGKVTMAICKEHI